MNGYSSHTFEWHNEAGAVHYVKYHFKTEAGIRNLTAAEAQRLAGTDPDHATRDLFQHLADGNVAAWRLYVQIMPEADARTYRWDPFDVTKVWPHTDYPLVPVGRMVLNRNPENYFAEVEQAAFSPGHLVPGIRASADKMLQGRLFSYPDTHRHRLGANYQTLPVNCPYAARAAHYHRDGDAVHDGNGGSAPNYEPNSFGGPAAPLTLKPETGPKVTGRVGRYRRNHPNSDFAQAGELFRRVLTEEQRSNLVANIVGHLSNARPEIQARQLTIFKRCDAEYGRRVEAGLKKAADQKKLHSKL
mmetsp:Transcript_11834/g.29895  ORF Transcript_11834/g.29895 Transcript_11834/m.29895 type:complete len:302 (+) Transcript_11834:182-1087(+)